MEVEEVAQGEARPTVARRTLARVLKERRLDKSMTIREAASLAGIDASTLSRVENAEVKVEPGTAILLLESYGVGADDRQLMLDVALAARQRGWWQRYSAAIPEWLRAYVGLETDATSIRTYEAELVPGVLQTASYARSLINADAFPVANEGEMKKRLMVREERQKRLTKDAPTNLAVVLNEAALFRVVGGPATMTEQLEHLVKLTRLPNITLQVLPFARGEHPGNYGPFVILDFPGKHDQSVVYIEYCGGSLYLEEAPELAVYASVFSRLTKQSLNVEESRNAIEKALTNCRSTL